MMVRGESNGTRDPGGNDKRSEKGAHLEDFVGYFSGKGHPHPISEEVQKVRGLLLDSGFDEIQTSHFVDAKDMMRLTGALYPIFKDSIYHLAWIRMAPIPPNPGIELDLKREFPNLDLAELWNILDEIDENTSGEDVLQTLKYDLKISMDDAVRLMNMVPALARGSPQISPVTLRTFMPTSWLSTMEATYDEERLPIRLFTVGTAYRNEPVQDSRHLQNYNVLSLAIFDRDLTLEKGLGVLTRLFDALELKDCRFVERPFGLPFFENGTEMEIFGGELELGTCGMMSSSLLSEMGMGPSVFIADLGIERMLMYRKGFPDIRELLYPQFYAAWKMNDGEIAASLTFDRAPRTAYGKEIASALIKAYKLAKNEPGSARRTVWKGRLVVGEKRSYLVSEEKADQGELNGMPMEVAIKEYDEGMGLFGPAAFDHIWVKDGNIIGAPPSLFKDMRESGATRTGISYVKAFSNLAAWKIERSLERARTGKKVGKIWGPEGINVRLDSKALHFILSHSKKVDVQGPVFLKFIFKEREA